jgi:hypothetical protein
MRLRRPWAGLVGVAAIGAFVLAAPGMGAQGPDPTERPIPTTPPGAEATRPPGPWVDPPPPPDGCVPETLPNDRPEEAGASILGTEFCVSGTLEVVRDQDLYFWEVPPGDGLTTWEVAVRGVPTTYTSVHFFRLGSAVGVTPLEGPEEVARADSDVWVGTPVPTTGIRLAPGPYLLGISRAESGYDQDITDDLGYWVELRRGPAGTLPSGDSEPNDDVDTAVPVEGAASFGGDAGGSRDAYRWQVPAGSAGQPWRIVVQAAPGSSIDVWLTDLDRSQIGRADADAQGLATIEDVGLATGTYLIWIEGRATADPYTLTIEPAPAGVDAEPNNAIEQAVLLDPATRTTTGRLTSDGDIDRFWVDVDAALADGLVDIALTWSGGRERQLCLANTEGGTIACESARDDIVLRGILLAAGRYLLSVDGDGDLDDRYTLAVSSSGIARPPRETEPNDDVAGAQPVSGAFAVSGELTEDLDLFAWTLSDADAAKAWHLDLSATLGQPAYLTLRGPDARSMADVATGYPGIARVWDLRLAPGIWTIELEGRSGFSTGYVVRAVEDADADVDPEPNDQVPVPLDPATQSARGRLAGVGDRDLWSFDLPEAVAATLTDIELTWPGSETRQLCLRKGDGSGLQCATGSGGVPGTAVLRSLDLAAGPYQLEVSGDPSPPASYEVRVVAGGPRSVDAESEPNDADASADAWDPALPMHGTARDRELDVYRIHMEPGIPHRWRLEVLGTGLGMPEWRQPDGARAGTGAVSDDATTAVVEDLLLVSGDHLLTLYAHGDYVARLTDLGELDVTAETEPNDTPEWAGRLSWGTVRHGRLAATSDIDVYRFSLAAPEHVVISAVPDEAGGGSVATRTVDLGGAVRPDDPRGLIDLELVSVTTRLARVPGSPDPVPTVLDALVPAGDHEVWLRTAARGGVGYTIVLERADPFLVPGAQPPPALPATLALGTATTRVAAYIAQGQRVDGVLAITNDSDDDLSLALQAATTDLRWTVELPAEASVPSGATIEVPITVDVPPDAWRDIPVRVTVAGRTRTGAQSSAWVDIEPVQDVAPVSPTQAWPLPKALLGGLDVGSAALGGVPGGTVRDEELVHDGYAVAGTGLHAWLEGGPLELTVDLAGDDPVPVVGTILNATAGAGTLGTRPREFELWLSLDGDDWSLALSAQATTLTAEQAFALAAPVEARFARLRILSDWGDPNMQLDLGEWKVVASPGWAPPGPFDVASGILGGHVVWTEPDLPDPAMAAILDGSDTQLLDDSWYEPDGTQRLVIGFRDDRAAQVTRLEWVEQDGTDPALRFARAQVGVSTGSPFGPWRSLGTWDLSLGPDGLVAPFEPSEPVWARFVHLTLEVPADQDRSYRTLPGQVRILERATADSYRSILGEWGQSSSRAILEVLEPEVVAGDTPDDADGPDDPTEAEPLAEGQAVRGHVARAVDVDWYDVTVPPGQNELTLRLATERVHDVRMTVLDAEGQVAPFRESADPATGERVWKAYVKPGETYRVGLEQPILSVVISFDTSGSVEPWWPLIRAAVRTFVDDITPGLEAAQVLPYQEAPLPPVWSDEPWLIRAALDARSGSSGSSCLACAVDEAAGMLGGRQGARALLVLGDAVGGGLEGGLNESRLMPVGPAVFTVHFGAPGDEATSTAIMQDLARTNGGFYQYATSTGEVDRAFDRMATWLRRPAGYTFSWDADVLPPGSIELAPAEGAEVRIGGVAVELVLDTSGSMLEPLGRSTRIAVAKRSLSRLIEETLPDGLPVALRIFKAGRQSCATQLAVPLGPLDPAALAGRIDGLRINKGTRTPLAAAIKAAKGDIGSVEGPRIVIVVTDGAESCKGDPEAAVRDLVEAGFETTVNIVGFALDDEELKAEMASWAEVGGGVFFDAQDQAGLSSGVAAALRAPFRVFDADGALVGESVVGGDAVEVDPGTYRVEVLSEPPVTYEAVEVAPGGKTEVMVGGAEG